MPQGQVSERDLGKYYNESYLAAIACGSFIQNHILRRAPICPHAGDTQARKSWFAGIHDSARDRAVIRTPA